MKINNKKELRIIADTHATNIDYQDFIKIYREYRECTKNDIIFW